MQLQIHRTYLIRDNMGNRLAYTVREALEKSKDNNLQMQYTNN